MKLLHLYSGNLYGGIERLLGALPRLASLCPEQSHSFGLCFRGKLWDELTTQGARVHDLGKVRVRYPWTVWLARRKLANVLRAESPDWVICHTPWPHAVFGGYLRRQGQKFATWFHDRPHATNRLDRWAANTPADRLFANSQYTAQAVAELFGQQPSVLLCPQSIESSPLAPSIRERLRHELEVPANTLVLFQASRLERWKGLHIFVEALTRLKTVPGWVAWLAGSPQKPGEHEYFAELQQLAQQGGISDRLKFLGWRADVLDLMQGADIFCQPNTGPEPFGLVFTEALSCGLPVVATAIGGALEIMTPECGILVPPNDAAAVAGALQTLIEQPELRERLGSAGPARARELVDPERQLKRLYDLLQSEASP